ncbi:MAG: hypothetical protein AB8B97_00980 [Granulosicoccus sp.]
MKVLSRLQGLLARGHEFFIVAANKLVSTILSFLLIKFIILALDSPETYGLYVYYYSLASWLVALTYSPANVPLAKLSSSRQNNFRGVVYIVKLLGATAIPVAGIGFAISTVALLNHPSTPAEYFSVLIFLIPFTAVSIGTASLIETYVLGQRNRIISLVLTNTILLARIAGIGLLVLLGFQSIQLSLLSIALTSFAISALYTLYLTSSFFAEPKSTEAITFDSLLSQYKLNWFFSVLSNSMLYIDKILLGYYLPIETIGVLALYQLVARGAANLTIGSVYQYVIPIYLGKKSENSGNSFKKHIKILSICIVIFMIPVALFGPLISPIGHYLSNGLIQLHYIEFILVCLAVCLSQSAKIIELEYFRCDAIKKLYAPLLVSTLLFLVLVIFVAPVYGLFGAICVLVVTAFTRVVLTLVGVRGLNKTNDGSSLTT